MNTVTIIFVLITIAVAISIAAKRRAHRSLNLLSESTGSKETRDILSLVEPFSKPAILIKTSKEELSSYFGGLPPQFQGFQWPHRNKSAMGFLACIDLSELPRAFDWLPKNGLLLFFYDMDHQPWGYDPKDRDGWEVLYVKPDSISNNSKAIAPAGLDSNSILNMRGMKFETTRMPPSFEESVLEPLNLTETEQEQLEDLRLSLEGDGANHQIGGYPYPIQDAEMALQCQLVSNGLFCGDSSGYNDPRAAELKTKTKDWHLLLQMDSDDELNVMWGDAGMIYFWIKEEDARRKDFSKVWLVLQCH